MSLLYSKRVMCVIGKLLVQLLRKFDQKRFYGLAQMETLEKEYALHKITGGANNHALNYVLLMTKAKRSQSIINCVDDIFASEKIESYEQYLEAKDSFMKSRGYKVL